MERPRSAREGRYQSLASPQSARYVDLEIPIPCRYCPTVISDALFRAGRLDQL